MTKHNFASSIPEYHPARNMMPKKIDKFKGVVLNSEESFKRLTSICLVYMFLCMRTTIHIQDHLFAELKRIAAESGRTLTGVIHDALRESLSRRRSVDRPAVDLPVFHGTGVMPGVDLSDTASLLDLMD